MNEQLVGASSQPSLLDTWQDVAQQYVHWDPALQPAVERKLIEHGISFNSAAPQAFESQGIDVGELQSPVVQDALGAISHTSERVLAESGFADAPLANNVETINSALVYVAEATYAQAHLQGNTITATRQATAATEAALLASIIEGPNAPSPTPLESLVTDGYRTSLVDAVEDLAAQGAPNVATETVHAIEDATAAAIKSNEKHARRNHETERQEAWQQQVFGAVEISQLKKDAAERFAIPNNARTGQELLDSGSGETRRPIMDIALDEESAQVVQQAIATRSEQLDNAIKVMTEIEHTPSIGSEGYSALLQKLGVRNPAMDNMLGLGSPGGTVVDLYIDESDLQKYRTLDAIILERAGVAIDSESELTDRIVNLAANTFPSGVELMHGTIALDKIKEHGGLATRSDMKHGNTRAGMNVNGAYIHMTRPGTVSPLYADPSAIGIPIDTIVRSTPYLHLEEGYVAKKIIHKGSNTEHSTQFKMGPITIRSLNAAPDSFVAAFNTMHTNLNQGLQATDVGKGEYNNLSFAASNTRETAGQYTYDLTDVHVYDDWRSGSSSEGAPLPNFDIGTSFLAFAPVAASEVDFTESKAGNNGTVSGLEHTIENIAKGHVAKFMGELITQGLSPEAALTEALKSVEIDGESPQQLIESYVNNSAVFDQAGISSMDVINRLPVQSLVAMNPAYIRSITQAMKPSDRQLLMGSYVNRLEQESHDKTDAVALAIQSLMLENSYQPTSAEQAIVDTYAARIAAENDHKVYAPPTSTFSF